MLHMGIRPPPKGKEKHPEIFAKLRLLGKYKPLESRIAGFQTVAIFMQSGTSEKTKAAGDSIVEVAVSDIVKDSLHKIFVGGIAEGLSPEMIMEIVGAFGTLKAFRFHVNKDCEDACAFLEYADHSVTLKACAGLNGMRLGGRVLIVAQAFRNTESVERSESHPFYGIPEHVKPLLEAPTQVLKLSNVVVQEAIDSLSETDLEEIVEDVRLECSRFGSVLSVNVVKGTNTHTHVSKEKEITSDVKPIQPPEERSHHQTDLALDNEDGDDLIERSPSTIKEVDAVDNVEGDMHKLSTATDLGVKVEAAETNAAGETKENGKNSPQSRDDETGNGPKSNALLDVSTVDVVSVNDSEGNHSEASIAESKVSSELKPDETKGISQSSECETLHTEDVPGLDKSDTLQESVPLQTNLGASATEDGLDIENGCEWNNIFEVGCVLVEFRRAEASCVAAHCLHGRTFDGRIVAVEYVPLKAYQERFPK